MFCPLIPAAAAIAIVAPAALATDRYFLDSTATSPSGRYRIDAKSPDNAGPRPRSFASNFTYTLTDTKTGKTVWTRKQPMRREKGSAYAYPAEQSPTAVYVTDTGLVVANLQGDTVVILDQSSGELRATVPILNAFPRQEQDDFVSDSTAGPIWEQRSDWFFVTVPASPQTKTPAATLFVVRPFWHHRIVIDTATGKTIDLGAFHSAADPAELAAADAQTRNTLQAIMNEEVARALATLKGGVSDYEKSSDWRAFFNMQSSLHTAAFRKLVQAEPQLRAIEAQLLDPTVAVGEYSRRPLVSDVRCALRAIGKTPAADTKTEGDGISTAAMRRFQPEKRVANAPTVTAQMPMTQVRELLGEPDALIYEDGHGYDFDVDATPPYTLRVIEARNNTLTIRIITPLAFLHDKARMRGR